MATSEFADRVRGLVFGAALGDAFGLAAEFLTKQQARHCYGNGPIEFGPSPSTQVHCYPFLRDGHRLRWQAGEFTDDTDQLITLIQSIVACGGAFRPLDFAARLKGWAEDGILLETDDNNKPTRKPPCGIGHTVSLVLGNPGFLIDPHGAAWHVWNANGRRLAANGAVMRSAVLGALSCNDEAQVVRNAISAAMVTHADPRCVVSCVVVNVLIARMLRGCYDERLTPAILSSSRVLDAKTRAEIAENVLHQRNLPLETSKAQEASPTDSERERVLATDGESRRPRFRLTPAARARLASFLAGKSDATESSNLAVLYDRPAAILNIAPSPLPRSAAAVSVVFDVIDEYSFLLPDEGHVADLRAHGLAPTLESLQLAEEDRIGYTFKALGAGLNLLTRDLNAAESPAEAFRQLITELTLEAGDSDTNACVGGALLGCRMGYKALPEDWVQGLSHGRELHLLVDRLLEAISCSGAREIYKPHKQSKIILGKNTAVSGPLWDIDGHHDLTTARRETKRSAKSASTSLFRSTSTAPFNNATELFRKHVQLQKAVRRRCDAYILLC
ncbi:hypothetical protein HDU86_003853 [Geranomyces michiganensis]|nr:hypothetical protein HDU86_003853 [Geranomyces michiganensis]